MYWSGRQPGQDSWIQVRQFSKLFHPIRSRCLIWETKCAGKFADFGILPPHLLPETSYYSVFNVHVEMLTQNNARIELGEIDTYISQHPLVRENVTLVRRDKDEEPTLVSYVVPDMKEWTSWLEKKGITEETEEDTMVGMLKRYRLLREDVRARLRTKLASYAVPSVIIPLRRLPLTPNYKVDKKLLPYPDAAALATAASAGKVARSHWTAVQKTVGQIWASRIGVPPENIDLDDGFIDSGGHSLRAQEVLFDIKRWAKISISMNTLFQNPTLREFSSVIAAALEAREDGEAKDDVNPPEMDYALDGEVLKAKSLPTAFPTGAIRPETVLVTGATGFLGFVLP